MNKTFLRTTADLVNGVWGIGSDIYRTVAGEISSALDEEAIQRTHRFFEESDIMDMVEESDLFQQRYRRERENVIREYKVIAIKGGLIALGLSWLL